tara:strand:+ start:97 stop:1203 length:1107 start_codon:yes stop_codon:yes gene_type:complete
MGSTEPLHVFMHTNRPTCPPPRGSGYVLHTGRFEGNVSRLMTADAKARVDAGSKWTRHPDKARATWMLQQTHKYQWMLAAASAAGVPVRAPMHIRATSLDMPRMRVKATVHCSPQEPWLLADTDIVLQCRADEVRRRWAAAKTELLVGAEVGWWPNHDPVPARNPYVNNPSGGWIRYPNSGMLLGTREGFARLIAQMRRASRYPCCPRVFRGEESLECWVDDQACMLAALQRDEMRAPQMATLDLRADVFLNAYRLHRHPQPGGSLSIDKQRGQLMYSPLGAHGRRQRANRTTPCALHFSGKSKSRHFIEVVKQLAADAWVVDPEAAAQSASPCGLGRDVGSTAGSVPPVRKGSKGTGGRRGGLQRGA